MSDLSFSRTNKHFSTATIYLYDINKEIDLIDLEDQQDKLDKIIKNNINTIPMEVNITFQDLIGDKQLKFIENKPKTIAKTNNNNVMQYIEVMDYIDKCNQRHALLMHQVAETKMQCRKLFHQYM